MDKFLSPNGNTYELVSYAINSETNERAVIYRKPNCGSELFVCSLLWWNSQGFIRSDTSDKTAVNKYSPSEDKIQLYMSLFAGRTDVFARRWESRSGKCGYSPVCLNEWAPSKCLKPTGKCADCQFKNYAELNPEAIENHLRGNVTLGIYPLLPDETCRFLAIDFDDEKWQQDILAVYQTCQEILIPSYLERSRSGNGGHLWIFFSDAVPASKARKLGSGIITVAMNKRHEITFSSYDRMFPNQDTMPKGGFGNLIALPLQKIPRKNDNSVFVNEHFIPYSDQWAFLFNIKKLSSKEVDHFVKAFGKSEDENLYSGDPEKPWEPKRTAVLTKDDFPSQVNCVLSNMIYIDKDRISSKGIAQLKRLASFKNPDFYKTQAMRLSTYGKPRIISTFDDTEQYIGLPRGLFDELMQIFVNHSVDVNITDKTNAGRSIDVAFKGELRPEQEIAKSTLAKKNCGVLSASTAFGKTVVSAAIIAERKVNTLILVHRTNLMKQWIERLNEFLEINEEPPIEYTPKGRKRKKSVIGQVGGTKNNTSGIIDVAVMQSLISKGEVKDIVKNYGMIIVDECHHVSAFTFEQILKAANARYVYGLTATPTRQDGHHPIIYMQCGPITYKADNKKQSAAHTFEHYMIPRFTSFKSNSDKITELYTEISENELRNELIVNDCIHALNEGRTPVILTERTKHVDILADKLKDYSVIKLVGGMGNKYNTVIMDKLKSMPDDEQFIVVATGKYIGEGFDLPKLDTLLLSMPISWKGTLQQYAGRLHRSYEGKSEVRIYDYIDVHVPMLEKMYQKRLKGYSSIGYMTRCEDAAESVSSIFDNNNFLDVFIADILSAKHEVLLVSPFVSKRTLAKLLPLLAPATAKITIITRPPEDTKNEIVYRRAEECIAMLKNSGFTIRTRSGIHQKFTVIDQRLIWYGSINFLSFGTSEESVMRLESVNIAAELVGSVGHEI